LGSKEKIYTHFDNTCLNSSKLPPSFTEINTFSSSEKAD
jgi:hypothetical protein